MVLVDFVALRNAGVNTETQGRLYNNKSLATLNFDRTQKAWEEEQEQGEWLKTKRGMMEEKTKL